MRARTSISDRSDFVLYLFEFMVGFALMRQIKNVYCYDQQRWNWSEM